MSNRQYNSRKEFIKTLFDTSKKKFDTPLSRYQAMGLNAYLTDYLNGETTNYAQVEKDPNAIGVELVKKAKFNKGGKRHNGFIALNVEAPTKNGEKSPIIPFFSILVDGNEDTLTQYDKEGHIVGEEGLRNKVIETSRESTIEGFYTCPEYMNRHNLEKVMFQITLNDEGIDSIDIPLASSFDESENERLKKELDDYIINNKAGAKVTLPKLYEGLENNRKNTFLYSWCVPFFKSSCRQLACNVRAVDRDEEGNAHSIFVCIFETEAEISEWVLDYGEDVMNLIAMVKSVFIADGKREQRKEAIKSAKAAIMSRNMSHNLGSHVMAYLKQHLCSVTNILQDNILSDFISAASFSELRDRIEQAKKDHDSSVKYVKEVSTEEGSLALPFLVGLGYFISYLQERQDFIATVATDYIPYYSTVNFKDFIYDELNPDKRYLRHKDRKNLQPDNILLGNIARSEGLGRMISPTESENGKLSDIVIKFRSFDGNPVVNESNFVLDGRQKAFDDLEFMRKIDVSLPGGMVGRQAIFSIIENIIRNAAKHGNWRSEGRLELTFDFIDKSDIEKIGDLVNKKRQLECKLNDANSPEEIFDIKENLRSTIKSLKEDCDENHLSLKEVLWLFYSNAIDKDDLYFFTITDNVKTSIESINKLRETLCEDYIDEDGVMIEGNKGIKELRISAAWLRGGKDESDYYYPNSKERITKPQGEKKAPLMYARQSNGYLQYIFCLLIPKRVAIVSESLGKDFQLNLQANRRLASSYWKVFSPSEYIKDNNKSYNFVLCDGDDTYTIIRPYSSSRVVKISDIGDIDRDCLFQRVKEGISSEECHRIELSLYRYFSKCETGTDFICVDDKKAYARYKNLPTTILYKWISNKETGEKSGYFLRSLGESQKEIYEENGLYDGMQLIPEHDYCKVGQVLVTDGGGFGGYVYRTHHDMNEEFNRFIGELRNNFKGCKFVESVTGNSSTDRLVRNDSFDDKWFFSHLRAMKQQIAIFDERLFAKLYGLEEVDFTRANAASGNLDEMKKEYIEQFGANFAGIINNCDSIDELNKVISSNPSLKRKLYKSEAKAKNRAVSKKKKKGVFVYTFVKNPINRNKYGMYGLFLEQNRTDILDAIGDVYHAKTGKLLDLSWENDTLNITPCDGSDYLNNGFDYISIHQGLLDKLYEAFGIKDDELAKVELTKKLYLFFKRGDQSVISTLRGKDSQVFMPGLSVHSGRSKPNKNDMPQLVPFIQYAAIEHATLDCKYSLVELLDNARYE